MAMTSTKVEVKVGQRWRCKQDGRIVQITYSHPGPDGFAVARNVDTGKQSNIRHSQFPIRYRLIG